jgi:hypothetical protein
MHLTKKLDCQKAYKFEEMKKQSENDRQKKKQGRDRSESEKKRTKRDRDRSESEKKRTKRDRDRAESEKKRTKRDRSETEKKRTKRDRDRSESEKKRTKRDRDRSEYYAWKLLMKTESASELEDFKRFLQSTHEGAIYVCVSCHKSLFADSVKTKQLAQFQTEIDEDIFHKGIHPVSDRDSASLCHNCYQTLKTKKQIPAINVSNGLYLDPVPPELKLTSIEEATIARNLIFEKLVKLPKSRMPGLIDKVINVPLTTEDVQATVNRLPRLPEDAAVVPLQFKRMRSLKNNHYVGFIRPAKCVSALIKLRELNNPHWSDIIINHMYENDLENDQNDTINSCSSSSADDVEKGLDEVEEEEEEYRTRDASKNKPDM